MGVAPPNIPAQGGIAFPSSALPASGFMGIISARDIKAPLTGGKDGERGEKKKIFCLF